MVEIKDKVKARVEPATGSLGAYVYGFDITGPLSQDEKEYVRQLMRDHHVVCFRGQDITPDQHVEFTRLFGDLYIQPVVNGLKENPNIVEVFGAHKLTESWHQDSTHSELPPRFSVLVARQIPPYGNDTQFSNQHKAYEALSPGLKRMLEGVRAVHRSRAVTMAGDSRYTEFAKKTEEAVHPVLRTHPETGRKALYVNAMYGCHFEDMTPEESRGLFEYLCAHCSRSDFTFRHRWQAGDVLIWDNASVQHAVVSDMPEGTGRYLHRTTTVDKRPY
jgi:taurine dioxygenase